MGTRGTFVEAQLLRTYDRCVEEHGSACTQPEPAEDWQSNVYDGRAVRVLSSRIVVAGSIDLDPPLTHVYFYTPELAMLNIVSYSTGRTADVIWFGSRPVADHGDSEARYTYTDHLGTPILQTTASGTVAWRAEHEPTAASTRSAVVPRRTTSRCASPASRSPTAPLEVRSRTPCSSGTGAGGGGIRRRTQSDSWQG